METETITFEITLPTDMAEQVNDVQRQDPEFFSRVALYCLTRWSIYRQLRERDAKTDAATLGRVGADSHG